MEILSGIKSTLILLAVLIPDLGTVRNEMTLVFALVFLHKYMSILLALFIAHFGVAVRGKAQLKILALASPYSEKPKVRYVSDFT